MRFYLIEHGPSGKFASGRTWSGFRKKGGKVWTSSGALTQHLNRVYSRGRYNDPYADAYVVEIDYWSAPALDHDAEVHRKITVDAWRAEAASRRAAREQSRAAYKRLRALGTPEERRERYQRAAAEYELLRHEFENE